jgi:hypothetical protein
MSSLPRRRTVDHLAGGRRPRSPGDPVAALPGHATSSSWAVTKTPRCRNAAGAWTTSSARAAGVSTGNQERRSRRGSLHGGAPRPSRAARCSASAARRTSHLSSLVLGGSVASSRSRLSTGSQRYSSRNSATGRHQAGRLALFAAGWAPCSLLRQAPSQNPRSVPSSYRRRCRPPAAARRAAGARRGTGARSGPGPPALRRWRPGRYD